VKVDNKSIMSETYIGRRVTLDRLSYKYSLALLGMQQVQYQKGHKD
jgi:hypothetical protein